MTWLEIMNMLFAAHRDGDVTQKYILMDLLDEVEVDYADTLDLMAY